MNFHSGTLNITSTYLGKGKGSNDEHDYLVVIRDTRRLPIGTPYPQNGYTQVIGCRFTPQNEDEAPLTDEAKCAAPIVLLYSTIDAGHLKLAETDKWVRTSAEIHKDGPFFGLVKLEPGHLEDKC